VFGPQNRVQPADESKSALRLHLPRPESPAGTRHVEENEEFVLAQSHLLSSCALYNCAAESSRA
jgi:hypothetical protein